jgi:hypothetical protein
VALSLLQQFPHLPLSHKSESGSELDGVQPLYALARMSSVFPTRDRFPLITYKDKLCHCDIYLLQCCKRNSLITYELIYIDLSTN